MQYVSAPTSPPIPIKRIPPHNVSRSGNAIAVKIAAICDTASSVQKMTVKACQLL
jgi:hypothetical protein